MTSTRLSFKAASLEELTFFELMRMALKQIVIRGSGSDVWLREEPRELHKKLLDLRDELGDSLQALKELHFITTGPFPYSRNVIDTLDLLQQSNAIRRENPSYQRFSPKRFSDTKTVLEADLARVFGKRPEARQAFDRFVDGLATLESEP
jgi:hypothetical protein